MGETDFIKYLRKSAENNPVRNVGDVEADIAKKNLQKIVEEVDRSELRLRKSQKEYEKLIGKKEIKAQAVRRSQEPTFFDKTKKWIAAFGVSLVITGVGTTIYDKQQVEAQKEQSKVVSIYSAHSHEIIPRQVFGDNMLDFNVLNNWIHTYNDLKNKQNLSIEEKEMLDNLTKNIGGAINSCEKLNINLIKYYVKDYVDSSDIKFQNNYEKININLIKTAHDPERYNITYNGKTEDLTDELSDSIKEQIESLGEWQSKKEVVQEIKTIEEKADFVIERYISMHDFAKAQKQRKIENEQER